MTFDLSQFTPTSWDTKASSPIRQHEMVGGSTDRSIIANGVDKSKSVHEIRDLPAVVERKMVVGIGIIGIPFIQVPLAKIVADGIWHHFGPMFSDDGSIA